MNETLTLGYALCGSFCTFEKSLQALEVLAGRYANIIPIFSEASATLDTRFGRATEHIARAEQICGRPALRRPDGRRAHRAKEAAGPADRRPLHRQHPGKACPGRGGFHRDPGLQGTSAQ